MWFKNLDIHADVSEITAMLAKEGLEVQLPEATYYTLKDFEEWYEGVTHLFFDESHELKLLDIVINNDEAELNIIVNWQTQTWAPPAAKSVWKGFDCYQKWLVKEDSASGNIVIKKYIVEKLVPMPGSPEL